MPHNHQKKIAAINDFCGFGKCSLAVSLPIISAMKIQCCPLPTSIFSNHTGYDSFTVPTLPPIWIITLTSGQGLDLSSTEF